MAIAMRVNPCLASCDNEEEEDVSRVLRQHKNAIEIRDRILKQGKERIGKAVASATSY